MPISINTAQARPKPDDPPSHHPPRSSKLVTYVIEGTIIFLAVIFGLVIRSGLYETAIVTSRSMEPTFLVNDRLLIDHRRSLQGHWARGDCVLFQTPETWSGGEDTLTKRLIGLPGERVEVRAGQVFINGRVLAESYRKEPPAPDDNYGPVTLGPGQYVVMGDNRGNSDDSRHQGPVREEDIRGRAVWRLTPLGRMGGLPSAGY